MSWGAWFRPSLSSSLRRCLERGLRQQDFKPSLTGHTYTRCNLANSTLGAVAAEAPQLADPPQAAKPKMEKPLAPPGLSRTFYKRILPSPPSIEFASPKGKRIFAQAMLAGTMEGFFKLIEQFRTQDEPAFCGLASLAMVLNTLSIDPRRTWKGPWRWFHEEMLDCCHPLSKVREEGITLEQAACLARCNGSKVEKYLYGDVGVGEFRDMVREACSSGTQHLIVSYSRKEFLQTGDGHFSPVGGYSEAEDMVLILDTARFKYPPHWVPLEMLYTAMARTDPATGKPRGFLRLGTHPRLDSVLFTIDLRDPIWQEALRYVEQQLLRVVREAAAAPRATPASVLAAAAAAAPFAAVRQFIAVRTVGNSCNGGVCTQAGAIELFLRELRGMPLFAAVAPAVPHAPQQQLQQQQTQLGSSPAAAGLAPDLTGPHQAQFVPAQQQQQQPHHHSQQQQQQQAFQEAQQHHHKPQQQQQQPHPHPQQQKPEQPRVPPRSAASSSHAVAASSPDAPAVQEDVTAERVCMLLMMVPLDVWQEIKDEDLRDELLNLLDTTNHKVVGIEAEYLQTQFLELQALQLASEQASAALPGSACSLQRSAERQEEEQQQRSAEWQEEQQQEQPQQRQHEEEERRHEQQQQQGQEQRRQQQQQGQHGGVEGGVAGGVSGGRAAGGSGRQRDEEAGFGVQPPDWCSEPRQQVAVAYK